MIFYVFETHSENIYKFGMSKKQLCIDRLRQYSGINKPKRIITLYNVSNGFEEEDDFKSFLTTNNISIITGREYFKYEGNINVLMAQYRLLGEGIKLNIQTNFNQEIFFRNVTAVSNDKTKKNEIATQTDNDTMHNYTLKPMQSQDTKRCNDFFSYIHNSRTSITQNNDRKSQNVKAVLTYMKLKYLIKCNDRYLFCHSLENLASHYNITLSGLRYRMKNKLIDIKKINIKLQHLSSMEYEVNKHGIVSIMKDDHIDFDSL